MGDRTTVMLSVPTVHEDFVIDLFKEDHSYIEHYTEANQNIPLTLITIEDVNYGELEHLDLLKSNGIPYTSSWAEGDTYSEGEESVRFTEEGECLNTHYLQNDMYMHYTTLKEVIKKPNALELIQITLDQMAEKYETMPWDNQVEYGKLYLTRKLLGANDDCDSTESA